MTTPMTHAALAALDRAGFSRRDFLRGAGALIVGFSAAAGLPDSLGTVLAQVQGSPQLDSWIAIAQDGRVTAYVGKCELGQGIFTAQTQLIAEELMVPISRVTLIECDTSLTPDQGVTSGAQSHPANFNRRFLALAGATAREALTQMASARLGAPVDQLVISDGVVSVKSDASKRVTYGELVGGKKFNVQLSETAKRRHPSQWTVLGTPVKRLDLPAVVTSQFDFVQNVRVPGMLHGRVVRPPVVGARLVGVDESSVRNMPGFVKVVTRKDFVGVVAAKPWQAIQIANALKATWSEGTALPNHRDFYTYLRNQKPSRDTLVVDSKDVDARLANAATIVKATYHYPYQMHGSVGVSCAVADVQGNKATVWSPTQGVYTLRDSAAKLLGFPKENIRVVFTRGSGCYGLNGADTVSYDALLMSQAVGKPVRVQLTRQDEMAWENYGIPFVADQRAAVDANGDLIAWDYEAWSATLGGRPGYETPGNLITGLLVGFQPAAFVARMPAPDPSGAFVNNVNTAPAYVAGCVGGMCSGTGKIRSERVLAHRVQSPFWTGPLRAPERLQNTFFHESFIDEVAAKVGADPVAYRLRHLSHPRLIDAVTAAAKAANWETRPSPKPGTRRSGIASGRGMACVAYDGGVQGYAGMVAEVNVDQNTGVITVTRLVISQDCGPISNPDGLRNQMEGGALHGMSRALMEEVTWDNQKVTSIDWRTYRSLPVGYKMPKIETVLINRMDDPATGAGETTLTLVPAAIANAVFDATGVRIRQVPFTPDRVKAALAART